MLDQATLDRLSSAPGVRKTAPSCSRWTHQLGSRPFAARCASHSVGGHLSRKVLIRSEKNDVTPAMFFFSIVHINKRACAFERRASTV